MKTQTESMPVQNVKIKLRRNPQMPQCSPTSRAATATPWLAIGSQKLAPIHRWQRVGEHMLRLAVIWPTPSRLGCWRTQLRSRRLYREGIACNRHETLYGEICPVSLGSFVVEMRSDTIQPRS